MDDAVISSMDTSALVERFMARRLEPIEKDSSRDISADEGKTVTQAMDSWGNRSLAEVRHTIIYFPLLPRHSNQQVVRLRASSWPRSLSDPIEASFRADDHMVIIRTSVGEVKRRLEEVQRMIEYLKADISGWASTFPSRILELVEQRKVQVTRYSQQFEQKMTELGIVVRKKPGAIEPINLQVKDEVRLLREVSTAQASQQDQYLAAESVTSIVGLIDQAGKGFELTPRTFGKLEEEELRDIIIGYLNAVFDRIVATGETFSKGGKSDIFINIDGRAVLITECKYWGGQKRYGEDLAQLFGYTTWRHPVGVMVIFSRAKGLVKVIGEADRAIQSHASYRGSLEEPSQTHRISLHEHPDDPDKTITVHHLFFNLYPGAEPDSKHG
jgi:hypothetical protein